MVTAWMNSPTHKANIVSPNYTQTGIAVLEGELDGVETTLVVQMFGKPEGTPISKTTQTPSEPATSEWGEPLEAVAGETDTAQETAPSASTVEPPSATLPQPTLRPLATPLTVYRIGIFTVLGFLLVVLMHDLWLAQRNKLERQVGRNLAHIVVILAVIITIVLSQTGKLL